MLVSNIRENGKLIGSLADGEMHFHSDFCYLEKPAKGTVLYAIESPSQGGDTLVLNMYKAYDTLPPELKARIDGRKAVNAYHYESLTRSVNEVGGGAGTDPAPQWEAWEKANKETIQRAKTSLSAIRRLDKPNIAALSVALRTLRSVIRVGASS